VDAQQIQELIVGSAAGAVGIMLIVGNPERFPEPFRGMTRQLGRYRPWLGAVMVLAGVATALS
jgi:hypothetical protein